MFNQVNEERFFKMLACAPVELQKFWDVKEHTIKLKSVQVALHRMDEEESVLLRFFVSVWFGNSDMASFKFFEHIMHMDEQARNIIRRWLLDPFFC